MDFYLTSCLSFLKKLDLVDIVVAWDEFKRVLHPEYFWNNGTYIYCVLEWNWRPFSMVGACVKVFFKSLE